MTLTRTFALLPAAALLALVATACTATHPRAAAPAPSGSSTAPAPSGSSTAPSRSAAATPSAAPSSPSGGGTVSPSASAGATDGATAPAWPRVTFAGLSFEIPPDWRLLRYDDGNVCVQPVHSSGLPTVFGCAGVAVKSGHILGSEQRPYQVDQNGGWYTATDVQPCPVHPTLPGGAFNGIRFGAGSRPVETGLRPVGDRRAAYDRWEAGCNSGYTFSPQGWYLPVSRVLFLDYVGHPQTARILSSVRFPG